MKVTLLKFSAITLLAFLVHYGESATHYILSPEAIDLINNIMVGPMGEWVPASAALPAYGVLQALLNSFSHRDHKYSIQSIPASPKPINYGARAVGVVFGNEDVSVYGLLAAVFAYFHGFYIVGLHIREKNQQEKNEKRRAENDVLINNIKLEVEKALKQTLKSTGKIQSIVYEARVEEASDLVTITQKFDEYAVELQKALVAEIMKNQPELDRDLVEFGISSALKMRRTAVVKRYGAIQIISKLKNMLTSLGMTIFEETPTQYEEFLKNSESDKKIPSLFEPFTNIIAAFDAIDEGNETHSPLLDAAYFGLKELRCLQNSGAKIIGVGRGSFEDNLDLKTWSDSWESRRNAADAFRIVKSTTDVIINGVRHRNMEAKKNAACFFVTPEPIKKALKDFPGQLEKAPFQPNLAWVTYEEKDYVVPDDVWDNPNSLLEYFKTLRCTTDYD